MSDALLVAVVTNALLLLAPKSVFPDMSNDWRPPLLLFPVTFVAGWLSSWRYYRINDFNRIDPFYIRAGLG
ncbi:MAG: hypothetical protein WCH40_02475, partial [Verrucomicrobiales bacterium]